MMNKKPGSRDRLIAFHRFDGTYRSAAYDGFDRMTHEYKITPGGRSWVLHVDGEPLPGPNFPTLRQAKEKATEIERSAQKRRGVW